MTSLAASPDPVDHLHEVQRPSTRPGRIVAPGTLDDALAALADPSARPIAGGTDLLIELARGQHDGTQVLVDLTRVDGLDEIEITDNLVTIGATVTHNRIVADRRLDDIATPLVQACREIGSPQLRNRATVVGNLVTASPANDTLSALLALEATVMIASPSDTRSVPIAEFHPGFRQTVLQPVELVTAVSFPPLGAAQRGLFLKLGLRRAQAISVVHLAAVVSFAGSDGPEARTVDAARLALGSVAPTVVRAVEAEQAMVGQPLTDAVIQLVAEAAASAVTPIDDVRADAAYRSAAVSTMTGQALTALRDGSGTIDADPVLLWGSGDGRWATGPDRATEHQLETAEVEDRGPADLIAGTVNGERQQGSATTGTLLDWLRSIGQTGVKEGCAEGECGACTVDLDGMSVMSCLVPPTAADGSTVVTIEGLATPDALHPLQDAFIQSGAVQCGYCIPGFLMAGAKLLEETPTPSQSQVIDGLAGNLCRCTGYYKIIDAVAKAAIPDPGVEDETGAGEEETA